MPSERTVYDPIQDPRFQEPYIDIDEWRDGNDVRFHYIHGGFRNTDTRFAFFFPDASAYTGRFFHFMCPVPGNENASMAQKGLENKIKFAIAHGAYFVESNMGLTQSFGGIEDPAIIYQASAAVAEYSRQVAGRLYGPHRPYGYIYGGSGGGFKTMSCIENTAAWDGAVPFVIGSPVAIPNCLTSRVHAMRLLRHKFPALLDAMEPGGGDMYAALNPDAADALREVTRLGFPPYAWFAWDKIGDGALPVLAPGVAAGDPAYFTDFWTQPGYLGTQPNSSALRDRLQWTTVVTAVRLPAPGDALEDRTGVDDAWQRLMRGGQEAPVVRIQDIPPDTYLCGIVLTVQSGAAQGLRVGVKEVAGDMLILGGAFGVAGLEESLQKIQPGDRVLVDNSDYIAIQTYHRHQVPAAEFTAWDQYRDEKGIPLYPQRPLQLGPVITQGGAGSLQSGRFDAKMIVVAALADESAYPWQADWYRGKVRQALGDRESQQFRLWYIDRALHADAANAVDELHFVPYLGALYQALLDLSDWVERDIAPAPSTAYSVVDGQVQVPARALQLDGLPRGGLQPVACLTVNGGKCTRVRAGDTVQLQATLETPAGQLVGCEWHLDGDGFTLPGTFTEINADRTQATVVAEYRFTTPGTWFPTLRVCAQRQGNKAYFTQIANLDRVRVVVTP